MTASIYRNMPIRLSLADMMASSVNPLSVAKLTLVGQEGQGHAPKIVDAYHRPWRDAVDVGSREIDLGLIEIEKSSRSIRDLQQAQNILAQVGSLDPELSFSQSVKAQNASLSYIFNHPQSAPFVKVFAGNQQRFTIFDKEGHAVAAGGSRRCVHKIKKGKPNQDCMAVVKSKDGSEWYLVADGVGGHSYGELASEVVLSGLGERLANNLEFDQLNFAETLLQVSQELDKVRYHLAATIIYNMVVEILGDLSGLKKFRKIFDIIYKLGDIQNKLLDIFMPSKALLISRFVIAFFQKNYVTGVNYEEFWLNLNQWVRTLNGPIFKREPSTTVTALRVWQDGDKKYYQTYYVGDSLVALFVKDKPHDVTLAYSNTPHSLVEMMKKEGVFSLYLPKNLSQEQEEKLVKTWMRNHPKANVILTSINASGQFYVGMQKEPVAFDSNQRGMAFVYTDGLEDDVDDYITMLESDRSVGAHESLSIILDYRSLKYRFAKVLKDTYARLKNHNLRFEAEILELQAQLGVFTKYNSELADEEKEKIQIKLHEARDQIEINNHWIRENVLSIPTMIFEGEMIEGIDVIDGEHADDETMIVVGGLFMAKNDGIK